MTASALAAYIIIGLFMFVIVGGGSILALAVALLPRLIDSDDEQSSYHDPAVFPENWK